VGTTSNHHAPYVLGYTRATMACNKGKRRRKPERNSKTRSQFGLWAATRPHEVGVASNRESACRGEYVPGPCTHRPSHHGKSGAPEAGALTVKGGAVEGETDDWGEVVTR
jgi:hypothetical protein